MLMPRSHNVEILFGSQALTQPHHQEISTEPDLERGEVAVGHQRSPWDKMPDVIGKWDSYGFLSHEPSGCNRNGLYSQNQHA
jgi:hypothetical protein